MEIVTNLRTASQRSDDFYTERRSSYSKLQSGRTSPVGHPAHALAECEVESPTQTVDKLAPKSLHDKDLMPLLLL